MRLTIILVAIAGASGCYASHERFTTSPGGRDGAVADAGDASLASLADAGPPDAPLARTDAGSCPPLELAVEAHWPDGPVSAVGSFHVTSTPVVFAARPGERPLIAFVSHPPQLDEHSASLGDPMPGPLRGGCSARQPNEFLLGTGTRIEAGGHLRIWDPRAGRTVTYPDALRGTIHAYGHPAVGDLDGDGTRDVVVLGSPSGTIAVRADGTTLWRSVFPPIYTIEEPSLIAYWGGAPIVVDLEHDDRFEVVIGNAVLEGATGEVRFAADILDGAAARDLFGPIACVGDLDGDGISEVVAGRIAFRADGSVLWRAEAPDGFCAIGDLDGSNAGVEIALVSAGYVRVLDGESGAITAVLQMRDWLLGHGAGGPPALAQFDDDPELEIVATQATTAAVYDLDCSEGATRCVTASARREFAVEDPSAAIGVTTFDLDGDGTRELVYRDEKRLVIESYARTVRGSIRLRSRTATEYPVIADVDLDGHAEIVAGASTERCDLGRVEPLGEPGLFVFGERYDRFSGSDVEWLGYDDGAIGATRSRDTTSTYRWCPE